MSETITVRGEDITVDLLLFRKYGVRGRGLVETLYSQNPGLSALGPVLPLGTVIIVPELPKQDAAPASKTVSLFG